MKIAVACGGTGGHVLPGLAMAGTLRQRGHALTLWLAYRSIEKQSIEGWTGPWHAIRAAGFPGGLSLGSVGVAFRLVRAVFQCVRIMRRDRPDVLLAMGSYSSVGPVLAARWLGVPVVLHEANVVPGRAISFLSRHAQAVAITFEATRPHLHHPDIVLVGYPVRQDLETSFRSDQMRSDLFTVLIMGGSQGAHRLNELACEAIIALHRHGSPVQVCHLTGPKDEAGVRARYKAADVPGLVFGFLREMGSAYRCANLAISRSGAGACVELAVSGLPALLIPLPSARRDHQARNADVLQKAGGVDVMHESELTVVGLSNYIEKAMQAPERLQRMRESLRTLQIADGATRLADLIENTARKHRKRS